MIPRVTRGVRITGNDISKTTYKFYKLLDDAFKFVGKENVIQVVIDNATNFKVGGE
jgi:hypothetical protein